MSKDILIPELRFPEFENEGEWEERFVDEFFSVGSSKRVLQEDWTNSGVPFYRTRELVSLSKNEPFGSEIFISDKLFLELSEKYGIPAEGDFLVSGVGTLGICYQVKAGDRFYFKDGNVLWFKRESGIDSTFFKFCFQSDHIQKQIVKQTSISTVGTYTIQNAKKTKLWYPPKPQEQQKIASCLSSLDDLISAHNQKLELLKNHKKGLMQNLFPQEGETVPKYRFKEFENDGEWVEKKLEDLAKRGSGHTPNKQVEDYYNGGINWVSLADSNKLDKGYLYETKIQISKKGIENSSAVLHPSGTVILSRDAGVGKSAVLYSEMAVSQHFIVWICDECKLSNWFLYYVLQILKPVFESIAVGSTIKTIGLPFFKELIISIPSISEQQKIASCLLSLDELIKAQEEKIEQLKLHKKGLMQGLFPRITD